MKILLVGSGGREHALAWKISQSPLLTKLYCAPGNPGTQTVGENVPIKDSDIHGLAAFAAERGLDLTVVGPELPLTLGIVDEFERRGLRIFGPNRKAAELEGSKVFAKQFMDRHRIPTARFKVAESPAQAFRILKSGEFSYPLVIKAEGLAAGKGVIVCQGQRQAEEAVESIMVDMQFGAAGTRILIEEHLKGKELSFIVISDGAKMQPLVTTMDHKAVYEGDRGPNTGGMGVISPSPFVTSALFSDIVGAIVFPTITRMREEGRPFKGVLYVGVMLMRRGAVAHPVVTTDDARNALLLGLIAAGALCIAAAVMLSRRLRTQAPPPSLSAAAQRWVQTRVLTLGLAEFPAVLGLVYALLTGDLRRMIALAAVAAAALLFFLPRRAALFSGRGGWSRSTSVWAPRRCPGPASSSTPRMSSTRFSAGACAAAFSRKSAKRGVSPTRSPRPCPSTRIPGSSRSARAPRATRSAISSPSSPTCWRSCEAAASGTRRSPARGS